MTKKIPRNILLAFWFSLSKFVFRPWQCISLYALVLMHWYCCPPWGQELLLSAWYSGSCHFDFENLFKRTSIGISYRYNEHVIGVWRVAQLLDVCWSSLRCCISIYVEKVLNFEHLWTAAEHVKALKMFHHFWSMVISFQRVTWVARDFWT